MHIALISGSLGDNRCGVGDYTYELAQHLALDAQVDVYFAKNHGPSQPPFEKISTFKMIELGGFSLITSKGLANRLSKEGYDIIHFQYPSKGYGTSVGPAFLPQSLTGMKSRSRLVATIHEWSTSHPLRKMVMDQMLPAIDTVFVSNEKEMQALSNKMGDKRIEVIPVGNVLTSRMELENVWREVDGLPMLDVSPITGPADRLEYSIFHYGLPAKGKGFDRLLEAVALTNKAGIPVTLHLAGDFPPGEKMTEEILNQITELEISDSIIRLGHIPRDSIEQVATKYCLGVFPFDEGYSSKRSSIATISHLDLPIVVGANSEEEHPFLAPEKNNAASLSVLLVELFKGRLNDIWKDQVNGQREYGKRFSFSRIAQSHLDSYKRLRRIDA